MRVLTFSFKVLSCCGVWQPTQWTSSARILAYKVLTTFIITVAYFFLMLQCALLMITEFDFQFMTEILFTLLTQVTVSSKAVNFILRRQDVVYLAEMLTKTVCLPRNEQEAVIQHDADKFVRHFTIILNMMAQSTLAVWLVIPVMESAEQRKLPLQLWLPYNYSQPRNYWITYGFESVPMVMGVMINATTDVIISGFMIQACTQLDILRHRLNELPNVMRKALERNIPREIVSRFERRRLEQTIKHHDYIMNYASRVNDTFDFVIVTQFFASSLILSVIVYELSHGNIGILQYIMDFGYLVCMLAEFFSYCWFGNEITLKSLEFGSDTYSIDWTSLSSQTNKTLLFIILRTSKPIILSCGHFIVLNMESFKSILKVSYSAFNVMKESAN